MAEDLARFFAELDARREAATHRERHGESELVTVEGRPWMARGCVLTDDTRVDATCLTDGPGIADSDRVWSRVVQGRDARLRRRGRLEIVPGEVVRFHDAPDADPQGTTEMPEPSLERDLVASVRVRNRCRSALFARLLYAAICRTEWIHEASGTRWWTGGRSAGGLVAILCDKGSYLDWYCSDGEGQVDEVVLAEIEALGWRLLATDEVQPSA
jgi:hypothetical protein